MALPNLDFDMGELATASGDKSAALRWYSKALLLQQKLMARHPNDSSRETELKKLFIASAKLACTTQNLNDARDWYRKALSLEGVLAERQCSDNCDFDLKNLYVSLAELAATAEDSAEAIKLYHEALVIQRRIVARQPNDHYRRSDMEALEKRLASLSKTL